MSGFDLCYNKGMVSSEIRRFFWDVDPEELDISRHKAFIIERILELGDEKAVGWLFTAYAREDITAILESSRSLSAKSRGFWQFRLIGASRV